MASVAAEGRLDVGRRRILFVGGKGGVGKTTVASAIALRLADAGEKCLLVSTDPAHSLGDLWALKLNDEPSVVEPNLWAMEIDPERQVELHLATVSRAMREFARPELHPEIERQMDLARLAPGAVEAAMLERVAEVMIDPASIYDRIIFDTAPTGHTLRLLALPEIMAAWTDGLLRSRDRSDEWSASLTRLNPRTPPGQDLSFIDDAGSHEDDRSSRVRQLLLARRRKFGQARTHLLDPATTGFILVTIPEKLPILETAKAVEALSRHGVPLIGLVVNRVLPAGIPDSFLDRRRQQEGVYLDRIDTLFDGLARVRVPLQPRDVTDLNALRRLGGEVLG